MNASPLRTKHKDKRAKVFQKTKQEPHSEYYPIFGSQHALFFKVCWKMLLDKFSLNFERKAETEFNSGV